MNPPCGAALVLTFCRKCLMLHLHDAPLFQLQGYLFKKKKKKRVVNKHKKQIIKPLIKNYWIFLVQVYFILKSHCISLTWSAL